MKHLGASPLSGSPDRKEERSNRTRQTCPHSQCPCRTWHWNRWAKIITRMNHIWSNFSSATTSPRDLLGIYCTYKEWSSYLSGWQVPSSHVNISVPHLVSVRVLLPLNVGFSSFLTPRSSPGSAVREKTSGCHTWVPQGTSSTGRCARNQGSRSDSIVHLFSVSLKKMWLFLSPLEV